MNDDIPRRSRIDKNTSAELAIRSAVMAVEESGCDPLLTDAVELLEQARRKVAEFVDARIARGLPPEERQS